MAYLLLLLPLFCLFFFISLQSLVGTPSGLWQLDWVPALDFSLTFNITALGNVFALAITFIGLWVYFYGTQYMKKYTGTARFWFFLSLFMIAMLGVVTADNLIALFVFWELTSICSYFLIGFYHNKQESRDSALMALLVTGLGGIILLGGFIILGKLGGSYDIPTLIFSRDSIASHPHAFTALLLIFIGAATKSAQFPFHFWLPNAMAAPAPVSSFLHSATMVKAGVFLMARLFPVLSIIDGFAPLLTTIGAITFLWGGFIAITEYDLKSILAHTTISALGLLILLLGMGDSYSLKAFMLFFLAHAFYKAPLFMIAGILEKRYGTRDTRKLGQALKDDKILSLALLIAAGSMMGLPPTVGFLAKETMLAGQMLPVIILGSAFNFIAALKICASSLFGKQKAPITYQVSSVISIAPLVLALTGLILGFTGALYQQELVSESVNQLLLKNQSFEIKLWHGFNIPLALSGLVIILSLIGFKYLDLSEKLRQKVSRLNYLSPLNAYHAIFQGTLKIARLFNNYYQSGYLRRYQFVIISTSALALFIAILRFSPTVLQFGGEVYWMDFVLGAIMVFAMIAAFLTEEKIWVISSLGIIGLSTVMFFVLYAAPDLALTQLMIEIFTLMIFIFAINKLPRVRKFSPLMTRTRDIALSIFCGGIFAYLTYTAFTINIDDSIASYYADNSYLLAQGKNIVNVILVDFRGFDTFGEVAVLLMSALGVFILLSKNKKKTKKES